MFSFNFALMAHQHDHHHHSSTNNLKLAFFLNLAFTVVEIIGGLMANSVAILSDAIHDLGDSLSLGLAWYLDKKSRKKATKEYSFGYARFSLLGALINSIILVVGAVYIIEEAIERLIHPEYADPNSMIIFAIIGVVVNGFAAWKMRGGKTLNEQVISWHLVEDVLGWAAILVGAIVLKITYISWLDPALSIAIMLYIGWGVVKRLRETIHLFLQGVPRGVDLEQLEEQILDTEGIRTIHHTHIWSLDGEHHVFSSHLKLQPGLNLEEIKAIKAAVKELLEPHGFTHYTIETEIDDEPCALAE